MTSLATEADTGAREGEELPAKHAHKLSDGGYACKHCGGMVSDDGTSLQLAADGEDEDDNIAESPKQVESNDGDFMRALRGRKVG